MNTKHLIQSFFAFVFTLSISHHVFASCEELFAPGSNGSFSSSSNKLTKQAVFAWAPSLDEAPFWFINLLSSFDVPSGVEQMSLVDLKRYVLAMNFGVDVTNLRAISFHTDVLKVGAFGSKTQSETVFYVASGYHSALSGLFSGDSKVTKIRAFNEALENKNLFIIPVVNHEIRGFIKLGLRKLKGEPKLVLVIKEMSFKGLDQSTARFLLSFLSQKAKQRGYAGLVIPNQESLNGKFDAKNIELLMSFTKGEIKTGPFGYETEPDDLNVDDIFDLEEMYQRLEDGTLKINFDVNELHNKLSRSEEAENIDENIDEEQRIAEQLQNLSGFDYENLNVPYLAIDESKLLSQPELQAVAEESEQPRLQPFAFDDFKASLSAASDTKLIAMGCGLVGTDYLAPFIGLLFEIKRTAVGLIFESQDVFNAVSAYVSKKNSDSKLDGLREIFEQTSWKHSIELNEALYLKFQEIVSQEGGN